MDNTPQILESAVGEDSVAVQLGAWCKENNNMEKCLTREKWTELCKSECNIDAPPARAVDPCSATKTYSQTGFEPCEVCTMCAHETFEECTPTQDAVCEPEALEWSDLSQDVARAKGKNGRAKTAPLLLSERDVVKCDWTDAYLHAAGDTCLTAQPGYQMEGMQGLQGLDWLLDQAQLTKLWFDYTVIKFARHMNTYVFRSPKAAKVALAPVKARVRAYEKVKNDYGCNWRRIGDLVRGTIYVETVEHLKGLLDELAKPQTRQQFFQVHAVKNKGWGKAHGLGDRCYFDITLMVKDSNGFLAELQLHITDFANGPTKQSHHKLYEEYRQKGTTKVRQDELKIEMCNLYSTHLPAIVEMGGAIQTAAKTINDQVKVSCAAPAFQVWTPGTTPPDAAVIDSVLFLQNFIIKMPPPDVSDMATMVRDGTLLEPAESKYDRSKRLSRHLKNDPEEEELAPKTPPQAAPDVGKKEQKPPVQADKGEGAQSQAADGQKEEQIQVDSVESQVRKAGDEFSDKAVIDGARRAETGLE